MKILNHIDVIVWLGITLAIANGPMLWAESKSTSVMASCRIVPRLQVSSSTESALSQPTALSAQPPGQEYEPQNYSERSELSMRLGNAQVEAQSNLEQGHHVANVSRQTPRGIQKIYTVTA